MNKVQATLAILTCAVGSSVWAQTPQRVNVKREIVELKRISRTILNRLDSLEASLDRGRSQRRQRRQAQLIDLRFRTPQRTFKTLQKALAKQQWSTVVACYTPRARDEIAKAMILASSFAMLGIEDRAKRIQYAQELGKLNKRHFPQLLGSDNKVDFIGEVLLVALAKYVADGEATDNVQEETVRTILRQITERQATARSELAKLVKNIKGRDAYLAAVLALVVKHGQTPVDYSAHHLVNLVQKGDVAQGFLVAQGKPRRIVTFKRVDGDWRVDQAN